MTMCEEEHGISMGHGVIDKNQRELYTKWPRDEPGRVTSHPTKIEQLKR